MRCVDSISVLTGTYRRLRSDVRVAGPDAADYLERMVSNEVANLAPGDAREALLLTPKARVIAPLVVLRRAEDDFLLLTEPELGEVVRSQLVRTRFAAKCEIEPEQHTSSIVLGEGEGIPTDDYGVPARRSSTRATRTGKSKSWSGCASRPACPATDTRSTTASCPQRRPGRAGRLVHEGLLPRPGADRAAALPREGEPPSSHSAARGRRNAPTRCRGRARRKGRWPCDECGVGRCTRLRPNRGSGGRRAGGRLDQSTATLGRPRP